LQFYNQKYGTSSTDPNRPHLRVQWNNWLGEQAWYKLESRKCCDRMQLKINVANGNLVVHSSDLAMTGTGLDLHVDRYYGSLSGDSWHIGNGWNLSVGCDVRLDTDDLDGLSYHAPDGYAVLFRSNGAGGYVSAPALDADLVKNGDGSYTLTWHADGQKFNFQSGGCLQNIVDRNGNKISMSYNGGLQSLSDTQGRVTSFTYASPVSSNFISKITDPVGRVFSYTYDVSKNLTVYTDPANNLTKYSYNANGQMSQITDPNGNVINIAYGSTYPYPVTQVQYMSASCPSGSCTTSFSYSAGTTVVTDANGNNTTYYHDDTNQGRVTRVVDAQGNNTSLAYTSDYNVSQYTDGTGAQSTYTYDGRDNLTKATEPTGANGTATYADTAHPYYPTSVTDPQGNKSQYLYDSPGNLIQVTDALLNVTRYAYNPAGTLASLTDAKGSVTSFQYDAQGNLTSRREPAPLGAVTYAYDSASRLTSMTDGKGNVTRYAYDALDRLTTVTYGDGTSLTYTFDANGNRTAITDPTGTTTQVYDALNRVTKKTLPSGQAISYGWDPKGNLTSKSDNGGTITLSYNTVNLLTSIKDPALAASNFQYDAAYRKTQVAYPNGVTVSVSRDSAGQPTSFSAKNSVGSTLLSRTYSYVNPASGLPTALQYSVTDQAGSATAYTYDAVNRLKEAKVTALGGAVTDDRIYNYDSVGNRLSQTINGTNTSYTYNAANELTNPGYVYDANGNLTGLPSGLTLSYNAANFTSSVTPSGGSAISMAYSGVDQTERVRAGSTSFAYDLTGLSQRADASGTVYELRDNAGQLLSERSPTGTSYVIFDALGSTIGLTDSSGNLSATWAYDPWGNVSSKTGSASTPFLFQGAYLDASTGLYKMGARFYDPTLGRWTQPDPVRGEPTSPETLNLYAFVGDNPVNLTDRSGYFWVLVFAIIWMLIRITTVVCLFYTWGRAFGWINGQWTSWMDWICIVVGTLTFTRWVQGGRWIWKWIRWLW
jgi:RHS repeat-associated protein